MSKGKRDFGGLDRLPSTRWRVRYRNANGIRVTAPKTFASKADAVAYLAMVQADILRGNYFDPKAGLITLADWTEKWLERPGKRAASVARDRQGLAVFVSQLGNLSIAAITPSQIQDVVDKRSREASPATVTRDFAGFRAVLNAAVDAELIEKSPARKIALPKIIRPERPTLNPDDLKRLVDELPDHYRALVLTAGVLGLSWEEAVALRVRDIDFKRETISVNQTVEELAGHITIVPEGKRPARLRTMAAPPFLLEKIKAHITTYRTKVVDDLDALVFVGPQGGILRRRFGERIFSPAADRAGIKNLTFHGLRHSATSTLVDVGVHPRVMASRIGHGTVRTTMEIYARTSSSADREAAALLQKRFATSFNDPGPLIDL